MTRKLQKLTFLLIALIIAAIVNLTAENRNRKPERETPPSLEKKADTPSSVPEPSQETRDGGATPDEQAQAEEQDVYPVIRVVDGDTLVIRMDGKPTKVRLIGVDTPETVDPRRPVQYFGKEASAFLKKLLTGEEVRLEYDPSGSSRDKYGRVLAYAYRVSDNLFVNAEIIRRGYGQAYTRFPFQYMEEFRSYEREARKKGAGLWANPDKAKELKPKATPRKQPRKKKSLEE